MQIGRGISIKSSDVEEFLRESLLRNSELKHCLPENEGKEHWRKITTSI